MSEEKLEPNHYEIEFLCANCGHRYKKQIRKGTPAVGQGGVCPRCGVRDNTAGVGGHRVIRANESSDPTGGRQILLERNQF